MFILFPTKAGRPTAEPTARCAPTSKRTPFRVRGTQRTARPALLWLFCLLLSISGVSAQTPPPATYVRSFVSDIPNQPLVTVAVSGATGITCLSIEEILPASATPISISSGGVYLPALNAVRWGPYFNTPATNVSYRLTGMPASYPINGGSWMDGQWFFSPGITTVTVLPPSPPTLPTAPPQVAIPVFTPTNGASVPVSVTITDATPNAAIYYTLDGSLPTQGSTLYTTAIPLATAGVVRAAAFTNGWTPSVAADAYYGPSPSVANAQVTRTISGNSTATPDRKSVVRERV